ncbi:MAG: guanylate kinase [Oscillospiraceae bacterium]|nr:guanylate kinase [Oscillospiraceae bacterium]
MSKKGKLIVVSGPSGVGKSSLIAKAMEKRNDFCFSVSVTTREARPGEKDGEDYFFISREQFARMVEAGELLEHASYVGNDYGTPRAYVEQKREDGFNVVLDIEVQGAGQVHEMMPEAVMIFVVPPSLEELEQRLTLRGTETPEKIRGRLQRAKEEYQQAVFYQYIIVNDDLAVAADEFSAIVTASHCLYEDRKNYLTESQERYES